MRPKYEPLSQRNKRPLYESVDFVPYDAPIHLHSPSCNTDASCELQVYPEPPSLVSSFLSHETTTAFLKWCLTFAIGVITAYLAIFISAGTTMIMEWKFNQLKNLVGEEKEENIEIGWAFTFFVAVNAGIVAFASGVITACAPSAAGSGIPETKSTLNGVYVKAWMSPTTLLCKIMGIITSVAGGLPVGREGPLIHIGAMVATLLTSKRSYQLWMSSKINLLREKDVRDLVTCGAAAGVAAAFGAPIGGVLFALEEGASFLSPKLIWRAFFCAMTANFIGFGTNVFINTGGSFTEHAKKSVLFTFGKLYDPSVERSAYVPYELLVFVAMGVVGGVMGAIFTKLNHAVVFECKVRGLKPALKVLYVVGTSLFISSLWFGLSLGVGSCKALPIPDVSSEKLKLRSELVQFYCGDGQYNDLASLFLTPPDTALKQLLHFDYVNTARPDFTHESLLAFGFSVFLGSAIVFGSSISTGVFIPCILSGAAFGRLFGRLIEPGAANPVNLSTYSLVGAAALLGGVTRMTISLTVIILEATGDLQYALPLMMTLMSARWVGNSLCLGLYDLHIHSRGIPFLDWSPPASLENKTVSHVIKENQAFFPERESVGNLLNAIIDFPESHVWPVVECQGSLILKGTIQRQTLVSLLLDKSIWLDDCLQSNFDNDDREEKLEAVDFSTADRTTILQLSNYLNPSPFIISVDASAAQAYRLFRSLGLSALCVVTRNGELTGLVTREELYRFSRQSDP
ncbi:channel voltage activated chloride channel [Thraustotheca clavata]|uniref:Chloride channel protein n=1 Tax=Thraustotheca clavata TaxID=74557 RepID=A0A1W0A7Q9_9STRA|nr:channel voltage activated chloride channel [Thraustotheca clavata]